MKAGIETGGGYREMKMGWRYKGKRLNRMHDGACLASSWVVAL